jgi:hypothetical protein
MSDRVGLASIQEPLRAAVKDDRRGEREIRSKSRNVTLKRERERERERER